MLTSEEIEQAQAIINKSPLGVFELNELYGAAWANVPSPTTFGQRFKATVEAGLLVGIKHNSRKSNNHHDYVISRAG